VTDRGSAALVLDEHLTALQSGLQQRGIDTRRVHDFHATSILDPDVIRAIARAMDGLWVLVTMDGNIVEEHPRFEWNEYAIAWILIGSHLRGVQVEQAKADVLQRHAHQMVDQRIGDHHTYTKRSRFRHPPSLVSARGG
jgi:hypothetical protein